MDAVNGTAAIAPGGGARSRGKRDVRTQRRRALAAEVTKAQRATFRAMRALRDSTSPPRQLAAAAIAVSLAAGRLAGFAHLLAVATRKA